MPWQAVAQNISLETLYNGQFTLSPQLLKMNYRYHVILHFSFSCLIFHLPLLIACWTPLVMLADHDQCSRRGWSTLCNDLRPGTLTVHLSTQEYNWMVTNLVSWLPVMDQQPTGNTLLSVFHALEVRVASSVMRHQALRPTM